MTPGFYDNRATMRREWINADGKVVYWTTADAIEQERARVERTPALRKLVGLLRPWGSCPDAPISKDPQE